MSAYLLDTVIVIPTLYERSQMRKHSNKPLPRLMTVPQFAAKCGKSPRWVRDACEEGRIPAAQWVVDRWVIPEDALIRVRYTDIDLPPEMIGEPYPDPEYKGGKGAKPFSRPHLSKLVRLPGFKKIREERALSQEKVYKLTGVTPGAQRNAERGSKVRARTAVKLARGLDVEVEHLLRRDDLHD
jgi:DNA-binding XRE family transcriptional regulator